jgi:hypothetical protein
MRGYKLGRQCALRDLTEQLDAARAEVKRELDNVRAIFEEQMNLMQRELMRAKIELMLMHDVEHKHVLH